MVLRLSTRICLAILSISLLSCGTSGTISRLEGTWGMTRANGGERLETWSKASAGTLTGEGLRMTGSDTVLLETLTLRKSNGRWQYIAEVPNQNDGKPIAFEHTEHNRHELVFTNIHHDFPQRIRYRLAPAAGENVADSMTVTLGSLDADQVILRFTRRR
jgi:hypothetical protein